MNKPFVTLIGAFLPRDLKYPPLGIHYLRSSLECDGVTVALQDYQLQDFKDPLSPKNLANFVDTDSPVIGFSCMSDFLPVVLLASTLIKQRNSNCKIFLGGPGPSGVALSLVKQFPDIDGVVIGEGEITFREIIKRLQEGKEINGVAGSIVRQNKNVIIGSPRPRIKDLDALPNSKYNDIDLQRYDGITIITSRGCPYKCSFCDIAPLWQRTVTFRSLDNIIAEIRCLRDQYGQKIVRIVDDTFIISRSRTIEFCHRMMNENPPVKWIASGRINLMDNELIELMSRAGAEHIFFGIESGSDRILKTINKGFTRADVKRVIAKASKYFNNISVSFIWGFPDETLDDFLQTVDLLAYCISMNVQYQLIALSPLAQSEICAKYSNELLPPKFRSVCGWGAIGDFAKKEFNLPPEVISLIFKYPNIFPGFYQVPTPAFEQKMSILKQLGFNDSPI